MYELTFQRAIKRNPESAKLTKRVISHTFRYSFVTHLLEWDMTFERFRNCLAIAMCRRDDLLHVLNRGGRRVVSPIDAMK
jgi:hypothetical protein